MSKTFRAKGISQTKAAGNKSILLSMLICAMILCFAVAGVVAGRTNAVFNSKLLQRRHA